MEKQTTFRPNALLFVKEMEGKKYTLVYIRHEDGEWEGPKGQEYIKTTDPFNLDPFENWLDYVPNKEWVHPVVAKSDGNGGWYFKAVDTYNEVMWDKKSTTLDALYANNQLFTFFDSVLDHYKNMTEQEFLTEINYMANLLKEKMGKK